MTIGKFLSRFEGGNALSGFRARALLGRLRAVAPAVESVRARHLHVVWSETPLSAADADRVAALLRYGEPFEAGQVDASLIVAPRLGTVSPWASKATDIARNCGLPLHRVEHPPGSGQGALLGHADTAREARGRSAGLADHE